MNWNKALQNNFTKLNMFKNIHFYPDDQIILLLKINLKKYETVEKIFTSLP